MTKTIHVLTYMLRANLHQLCARVRAVLHQASGKKTKFGGLGTTKASEKLDFAEGGLGEAERIKQLSYDRQREEEEEKAKKLLVRLWHSKPRNGD
jgi:hypothetical protein